MNTEVLKEGWTVQNAVAGELPAIMKMYDAAIRYQQQNGFIGWQSMDENFIRKDLEEGLLFTVRRAEVLAVAFCICYADPLIWRHREQGDALYLHRIVVHPELHGARLFEQVLAWARLHGQEKSARFLRMDTWAANKKLIGYYERYGFRFVEDYRTADDPALPVQHRNLNVALLELPL